MCLCKSLLQGQCACQQDATGVQSFGWCLHWFSLHCNVPHTRRQAADSLIRGTIPRHEQWHVCHICMCSHCGTANIQCASAACRCAVNHLHHSLGFQVLWHMLLFRNACQRFHHPYSHHVIRGLCKHKSGLLILFPHDAPKHIICSCPAGTPGRRSEVASCMQHFHRYCQLPELNVAACIIHCRKGGRCSMARQTVAVLPQ